MGRWNPSDPKAEIEVFSQTVQPEEDGYVDSGGLWDNTSVELKVRNDKYALLKFNIPDMPDIITVAMLQLYCRSGSGDSNVSLHTILQPWDSGTVDWATVSSPGFFDPAPLAATYVATTSITYSWILNDYLRSIQNGIILIGDDGDEKSFASLEETADPIPMLWIEGYNKL